MKIRVAHKIYTTVARYKGFETERQPYTKAQQRRAIITLKIPVFLRPALRLCEPVRKPYRNASQFLHAIINQPNRCSDE